MAPAEQLESEAPPPRDATFQRLERLAETLSRRGMWATLVAPPARVPRLQVVHPVPGGVTGDIYVSRCRNGSWWFWWPWAERIAEERDLDAAAAAIEQALAAP
jgi:hypothetical protein